MGAEVIEEAIVVVALPILETFKVDLTRLLLFGVLNFFAGSRNVSQALDLIHNIELQSPDYIGRIFNASGFFERFKGNLLKVVEPVEGTDDDEGGIGLTLEGLELADSVVNAELDGIES